MTKPKGLAALAELEPKSKNRGVCSIADVLDEMSPEDAETLRGYLADRRNWPHTRLSRLLRKAGHDVAGGTIGRHRLGDCDCA